MFNNIFNIRISSVIVCGCTELRWRWADIHLSAPECHNEHLSSVCRCDQFVTRCFWWKSTKIWIFNYWVLYRDRTIHHQGRFNGISSESTQKGDGTRMYMNWSLFFCLMISKKNIIYCCRPKSKKTVLIMKRLLNFMSQSWSLIYFYETCWWLITIVCTEKTTSFRICWTIWQIMTCYHSTIT